MLAGRVAREIFQEETQQAAVGVVELGFEFPPFRREMHELIKDHTAGR
jgi:hypothetical protein